MTPAPARPAAYARTAAPAGSELALARQVRAARDEAAAMGWPEPVIYTDTGLAGGPGFQALDAAITAGHHDAVITIDSDRISRRAASYAQFEARCTVRAVTLHLITGPAAPELASLADPYTSLITPPGPDTPAGQ